ncbi:MoaB/Mog domain-containing protein [Ephemerocybe angulata]|uniref:MoaB/Mog domain-containing protein n=1 Tax=Ephemerocybe angulata TaxID=980116 RepID=A0A8H6HR72_9AGAR|nr:MoaB/Mog domain-containing protein [Tulosesus angulatus]
MPTRSTSVTPGVSTATTSTGGPASAGSSSGDPERPTPQFEVSPVPPNPLGEGRCIRTAAALIIGDEILNGKTLDSNSHVFAQFCFQHGIDLKRIEVIPDVEDEIIEAARRLSSNHDLVVTSGGIGPTHDDITYASLAKAFNTTLVHHDETIRRMKIMNKHRKWATLQTPEQKEATLRMALFPANAEVIFVDPEIWVPVVRLGGKLCVFPGVPGLFQRMIKSLANFIPLPPKSERPRRIQIFTDRAESLIAPYLTKLQARLRPHNIQVGSYPILYKGVFVSLIGKEAPATAAGSAEPTERVWLADIAKEVEREIGGRILSEEEVVEHKKQADLSTKWEEAKGMLKEAEAEAKEGSHRTVGLKAKI